MTDAPRRISDRELSRYAATRRGIHARLAEMDAGRAPDFDPRHTLRLRVEFARQLSRRRTQITFGLLLVLPIIIAVAFKVGGGVGSGAPQLVELATSGGFNNTQNTKNTTVGFL